MKRTCHLPFSRRLLFVGASGLAIAGCSGIVGPSQAPKLYVLRSSVVPLAQGAKIGWALSVALPIGSAAFDTDRIAISRSPGDLDYFADAAWSDRLPAMVQTALVEAFESSGCIDRVARDADGIHSDYILRTDLHDFTARYDKPDDAPVAVIHIGVKLIDALKRDIVGHFDVVKEVSASANSVAAAVVAFDKALTGVLTSIVMWTLGAARLFAGNSFND